jgi:outer membrane protein OmpA-like peptidoglycan-associated protein
MKKVLAFLAVVLSLVLSPLLHGKVAVELRLSPGSRSTPGFRFAPGSAEIPTAAYDEIYECFKFILDGAPGYLIEIQGHTDSTEASLDLSQRRAEAVRELLIRNYGVEPERVVAKGYRETLPYGSWLSENSPVLAGKEPNHRRVDFVVMEKAPLKEPKRSEISIKMVPGSRVTPGFRFAPGSAEIPTEAYEAIDRALTIILEGAPDYRIEIQGHTDSQGSAKEKLALSQRRAEAVRDYLIREHGINPDRLVAKGYGDSVPFESWFHRDVKGEEKQALNNRVDLVVIE